MKINQERLDRMSKEELIAELIERIQEADDRETEIAGGQAALKIEASEADKYAKLLRETDLLVKLYREGHNDVSIEENAAALRRWESRILAYEALKETPKT